jgi:hypothetical protein
MVDVEKASAADSEKMRGGWLADEVGMGKVSSIFFLLIFNIPCCIIGVKPTNSVFATTFGYSLR